MTHNNVTCTLLYVDTYLDANATDPISIADFGTCEGQTFFPLLKKLIGKYSYYNKEF
jgi:hypothetical protein